MVAGVLAGAIIRSCGRSGAANLAKKPKRRQKDQGCGKKTNEALPACWRGNAASSPPAAAADPKALACQGRSAPGFAAPSAPSGRWLRRLAAAPAGAATPRGRPGPAIALDFERQEKGRAFCQRSLTSLNVERSPALFSPPFFPPAGHSPRSRTTLVAVPRVARSSSRPLGSLPDGGPRCPSKLAARHLPLRIPRFLSLPDGRRRSFVSRGGVQRVGRWRPAARGDPPRRRVAASLQLARRRSQWLEGLRRF